MILELQKVDLSAVAAQAADATFLGAKGITEADGVQVIVRPGEWGINSVPGIDARATVSKAAVVGQRHVCTSISATFATGAAAQAVLLTLLIKDGATNVLAKSWIGPANATWEVNLAGLNLVGSVNTAMTIEFGAVGATGSAQSCCMTGYTAA